MPTKVHLVKAMVFPVVMYGCESWAVNKAEHQRIDAFELRCWKRLLRVPLTAKRSNQSILKEISPEYALEGFMLSWNSNTWPSEVKNWLTGKDPEAGKDWRQEEKGMTENEMVGWHHRLDGHESEQTPGVGDGQGSLVWWTGKPGVLQSTGSQRVRHDWATELNWILPKRMHYDLLSNSLAIGMY